MTTGVTLKKNVPRPVEAAKILAAAIGEQWASVGDEHIKLRERLVGPWEPNNRPVFSKQIGTSVVQVKMIISMSAQEANQARISVYELLDQGTDIRYVRVNSKFRPQTTKGVIKSRTKRGDIIRKADGSPVIFKNNPAPGIEEREFDKNINAKMQKPLRKATDLGVSTGMRRILS